MRVTNERLARLVEDIRLATGYNLTVEQLTEGFVLSRGLTTLDTVQVSPVFPTKRKLFEWITGFMTGYELAEGHLEWTDSRIGVVPITITKALTPFPLGRVVMAELWGRQFRVRTGYEPPAYKLVPHSSAHILRVGDHLYDPVTSELVKIVALDEGRVSGMPLFAVRYPSGARDQRAMHELRAPEVLEGQPT